MHSGKSVNVKLKIFNENAISDCLDWFGQDIEIYKQNDEIFANILVNENAIIYWALQYGSKVEVLSPKSVRDKIKQELLEINKHYLV